MSPALMYGADAVAILTLVAFFVRRHGRRELIAAFLGVNVGVLAVAASLATSAVNAGLGLGLFGVLSIIRLRSEELAQHEVAYYFAALALGLIGGLSTTPTLLHLFLMVAIVVAVWVGDHPRIARRTSRQDVLLDRALSDPAEVEGHLRTLFGGRVQDFAVTKTDVVNDTTLVVVRLGVAPAPEPLTAHPAARATTVPAVTVPATAAPADELVGRPLHGARS